MINCFLIKFSGHVDHLPHSIIVCLHVCVYMYVCVYVCLYVFVYVSLCMYVYVCACVCVCACISVSVCCNGVTREIYSLVFPSFVFATLSYILIHKILTGSCDHVIVSCPVDKPLPPSDLNSVSLGNNSALVSWSRPTHDGSSAITGYLLEHKRADQVMP